MLNRKLFLTGGSSYAVILPKTWVIANKLTKGSFLQIEKELNRLVISPIYKENIEKPIPEIKWKNIKLLEESIKYLKINGYTNISLDISHLDKKDLIKIRNLEDEEHIIKNHQLIFTKVNSRIYTLRTIKKLIENLEEKLELVLDLTPTRNEIKETERSTYNSIYKIKKITSIKLKKDKISCDEYQELVYYRLLTLSLEDIAKNFFEITKMMKKHKRYRKKVLSYKNEFIKHAKYIKSRDLDSNKTIEEIHKLKKLKKRIARESTYDIRSRDEKLNYILIRICEKFIQLLEIEKIL